MQPVQALLEVAAYPDPAINSISFNFWHRLMHHLTSGFSLPEEDLQQPQSEVGSLQAYLHCCKVVILTQACATILCNFTYLYCSIRHPRCKLSLPEEGLSVAPA